MDKLTKKNTKNDDDDSSSEQQTENIPITCLSHLSLEEKTASVESKDDKKKVPFQFLKTKQIEKRKKYPRQHTKDKNQAKIDFLTKKIQELQRELKFSKREDYCPNCHFYLHQEKYNRKQLIIPEEELNVAGSCDRRCSKESLEFQKFDFSTPMMLSPDMQQKSWIFLGMIMIAMGSKVIDFDGTVNVFKVLKESVDSIRRQVDKSQPKLSMDFFMCKQELQMNQVQEQFGFDPFQKVQEQPTGLQLQGVRLESVQEFDLFFDQKIRFNVKYEALLTIMEYMREHCNINIS